MTSVRFANSVKRLFAPYFCRSIRSIFSSSEIGSFFFLHSASELQPVSQIMYHRQFAHDAQKKKSWHGKKLAENMLWLLLSHGRDKLWIFSLSFFKFWWLIAGAMKKWQVKNIDGWILFEYSANNGISLQKIDLCADCRPTMVSTQDDSLVTAGMQGAKTVEVR